MPPAAPLVQVRPPTRAEQRERALRVARQWSVLGRLRTAANEHAGLESALSESIVHAGALFVRGRSLIRPPPLSNTRFARVAASATTTEVVAAPDDGGVNDSENAVGEGVVQSTGGAVHKFELVKGKNIKWRIIRDEGQELAERTGSDVIEESSGDTAVPKDKPKVERHNLYVDDSTQVSAVFAGERAAQNERLGTLKNRGFRSPPC